MDILVCKSRERRSKNINSANKHFTFSPHESIIHSKCVLVPKTKANKKDEGQTGIVWHMQKVSSRNEAINTISPHTNDPNPSVDCRWLCLQTQIITSEAQPRYNLARKVRRESYEPLAFTGLLPSCGTNQSMPSLKRVYPMLREAGRA